MLAPDEGPIQIGRLQRYATDAAARARAWASPTRAWYRVRRPGSVGRGRRRRPRRSRRRCEAARSRARVDDLRAPARARRPRDVRHHPAARAHRDRAVGGRARCSRSASTSQHQRARSGSTCTADELRERLRRGLPRPTAPGARVCDDRSRGRRRRGRGGRARVHRADPRRAALERAGRPRRRRRRRGQHRDGRLHDRRAPRRRHRDVRLPPHAGRDDRLPERVRALPQGRRALPLADPAACAWSRASDGAGHRARVRGRRARRARPRRAADAPIVTDELVDDRRATTCCSPPVSSANRRCTSSSGSSWSGDRPQMAGPFRTTDPTSSSPAATRCSRARS